MDLTHPQSENGRLAFVLAVSGFLHLALLASLSGTGPGGRGGGYGDNLGGHGGKSLRPGFITVARLDEASDPASPAADPSPAVPPQLGDALILPAREKPSHPAAVAKREAAAPASAGLGDAAEPGGPEGPGFGNGRGSGVGDGTGSGLLPFGLWGDARNRAWPQDSADDAQEPVIEPRIAFCPKPKYPPVARSRRLEGSVRLQIEILPDGSTGKVAVLKSSGFAELDEAAVENLKQDCKFFPGQRGGVPVTRRAERTVRFTLEDAE